jgi:hypothetical protein
MMLDLWTSHMERGDFEAAWKISDAFLISRAGIPCSHLPRHQQYVWKGEPLRKKRLLVRCYHGLGDTIQFIRYAPLLKSLASQVIVWAQPGLLSLLRTVKGIDILIPLDNGDPDIEYDLDVEIMELPYIFRTSISTVPATVPYIHVDPLPFEKDQCLAVGLVWRAGDWDDQRSIPVDLFAPLKDIANLKIFILQQNPITAGWKPGFGILSVANNSLDDARMMKSLDMMISVDTMPAHLAGALGIPVWTLLQADADWRWMRDRADSPWYPSMRLFRQQRSGEWESVIDRVVRELKDLSAKKST